jgi:membrane associated rhomboid family serine protease
MVVVFYGQVLNVFDTSYLGIYPRHSNGLLGILTSPFVHGDLQHLLGNLSVLFPLLILLKMVYRRHYLIVLAFLWLGTGFAVWVFARPSFHIGASGIVYAVQGFLLISGIVKRLPWMMAVGGVSIMLFGGGFLMGLLPIEPHVSWESHLLGAIMGVLAGLVFKNVGPTKGHKKTRTLYKDEYELFDVRKSK